LNKPSKTNARAHVQSQTQYFEFDLNLTKIQETIKNILSSRGLNLKRKNKNQKPRTHIQNQTYYFEFDLSLTKNR